MVSKYLIIFLSISFLFPLHAANPISPGTPVVIITTNNVTMPVVVSGTAAGFMTMAVLNSDSLQANFSTDDGATWSTPSSIFENAYLPMWVSGNSSGFMATWIGSDIGYITAMPLWSFSSDQGATWSSAGSILPAPSTTVYSPAVVASTDAGFMVAWNDSNDNNAYASFTSDNGGTWSTPVNISNSGIVASAVLISGTAAGFMATWRDSNNNAYSAFTNNNGATWGTPSLISNTDVVISDVWVGGNDSGFMATWSDSNNNGYASFSSDNGNSWTSPLLIADDILLASCQTDVSVTGATSGFVAAWIGADNNAYASFSPGSTTAWSTPVQITTDGSVIPGNVREGLNGYGFVGVDAVGDNCLFAWLGNNNDTYSSFSTVIGSTFEGPTNLTGVQKKNSFGLVYELFNTLHWDLSVSTGVMGYQIFSNGNLLATVGSTIASYEDHNQKRGATTEYSVVAFDANGNISSPATVIV